MRMIDGIAIDGFNCYSWRDKKIIKGGEGLTQQILGAYPARNARIHLHQTR